MVSGISSQGNYNFYRAAASNAVLHNNDVENMVKFINGQPITANPNDSIGSIVTSSIPMLGVFGLPQAISTWKNSGYDAETVKNMKNCDTWKGHGWNLKEAISRTNAKYPYTRSQAINAGLDSTKNAYNKIFEKNPVVKAERGFLGKILDKIPGYSKLRNTGFGQAMGKSGAGWMAVLDGAVETFTQVVPTFKTLGFESGMKQVGKSTAKVVAGTAGFVAGDVVGKGIGAAIGTAICPGVGTAIGSFVGGFIGGLVGSALAGKATKAIVGKNELEKHAEQQSAQVANQVASDPEVAKAAAMQTIEQANAVLAQDPENKDALTALESAQRTLASLQEQEITRPQAQNDQSTTNYTQGFVPAFGGIPVVPGFNGLTYDMDVYNAAMSKASMPVVNNNQQKLGYPQYNFFNTQAAQ